jgi:hypothetical protein
MTASNTLSPMISHPCDKLTTGVKPDHRFSELWRSEPSIPAATRMSLTQMRKMSYDRILFMDGAVLSSGVFVLIVGRAGFSERISPGN